MTLNIDDITIKYFKNGYLMSKVDQKMLRMINESSSKFLLPFQWRVKIAWLEVGEIHPRID